MEEPDYLYHYTSIESLALILSNGTIRFKNLEDVDDLEEVESADVPRVGRFVVVSCWTDSSRDSLPMWSMYTPGMKGVRIKLPKYPFVKYHFNPSLVATEPLDSYINLQQIYNENKGSAVPNEPHLIRVNYTNDENLIKPKVLIEEDNSKTLLLEPIGKYKRCDWDFQSEWRYKISFSPWGMGEMNSILSRDALEEHSSLFYRLLDVKTPSPYQYFDLSISQECLDNIEILLGPKTTDAEIEIVKLLTGKYCANAKIEKSELKIK